MVNVWRSPGTKTSPSLTWRSVSDRALFPAGCPSVWTRSRNGRRSTAMTEQAAMPACSTVKAPCCTSAWPRTSAAAGSQHAHSKDWWPKVQRQTVDWFPRPGCRLAPEGEAIREAAHRHHGPSAHQAGTQAQSRHTDIHKPAPPDTAHSQVALSGTSVRCRSAEALGINRPTLNAWRLRYEDFPSPTRASGWPEGVYRAGYLAVCPKLWSGQTHVPGKALVAKTPQEHRIRKGPEMTRKRRTPAMDRWRPYCPARAHRGPRCRGAATRQHQARRRHRARPRQRHRLGRLNTTAPAMSAARSRPSMRLKIT